MGLMRLFHDASLPSFLRFVGAWGQGRLKIKVMCARCYNKMNHLLPKILGGKTHDLYDLQCLTFDENVQTM